MTEIEPTVDNVRVGDVVTYETGKPGEPGYTLEVRRVDDAPVSTDGIALATVRGRARGGYYRLTRITRPAPPPPARPGERFWARYESADHAEEFIVTRRNGATLLVSLYDGLTWTPEGHSESFTVVPAPEPETVKYEKETSND